MKNVILILISCFSIQLSATQVSITTNMGNIEVELYDKQSPETVENFLKYVDSNFYDDTIFHRVIPGFMAQGGGFTKDMERKKTRSPISYEGDNGLSNDRGTLSMARTANPDSATSQFFINFVHNINLNHSNYRAGYTVFGKVIEGMEIVDLMASKETTSVGPYRDVPVSQIIIETITRR